jgi:hypothetical protein
MSKLIQVVKWTDKPHFGFIRGNPAKQPSAFHLIYKWSLWLGFIEIRKFLTEEEMKERLEKYNKITDNGNK